jgi:hypothetical protein
MIPVRPGGIGNKGIRVGIARVNWTLSHSGGAIVDARAHLEHAMKMERRILCAQGILHSHGYRITKVRFNVRDPGVVSKVSCGAKTCSRPFPIDANHLSRVTIWSSLYTINNMLETAWTKLLTVTQPTSKLYVTVFADAKKAHAARTRM